MRRPATEFWKSVEIEQLNIILPELKEIGRDGAPL
jgi:hypothetical protein